MIARMEIIPHAGIPEPDDFALMEAIAKREPEAMEHLFERHSGSVFALCLRVLRHRADAEDVLQEVFWEIWTRAERYDPYRATARTYLVQLARSRALDRLRRLRRHAEVSETELVGVRLVGNDQKGMPLMMRTPEWVEALAGVVEGAVVAD